MPKLHTRRQTDRDREGKSRETASLRDSDKGMQTATGSQREADKQRHEEVRGTEKQKGRKAESLGTHETYTHTQTAQRQTELQPSTQTQRHSRHIQNEDD